MVETLRRVMIRRSGIFGATFVVSFLCLLSGALPLVARSAVSCDPPFHPTGPLAHEITALCGQHGPEDLEPLPDGKHVIISETAGEGGGPGSIALLDVATDTVSALQRMADDRGNWADPACTRPNPAGDFRPHGIHLSTRPDGALQLLVVNHAHRESVEFYELTRSTHNYAAIWRGCVVNGGGGMFNDVSATPDGGFVATISFEKALFFDQNGKPKSRAWQSVLGGQDTGYLVSWLPHQTLRRLPGSEAAFNNGIQVSGDGSLVYFAAWTGKKLHVYDLRRHRIIRTVALDFYPDNLSLSKDGALIAAGIKDLSALRRCVNRKVHFCPQGFTVASWDTQTDLITPVFDWPPGLIDGASVGVRVGAALYVGAFNGDRILKIILAKWTAS